MSTGKKIIEPIVIVNNGTLISSFQSLPFSIQRFDRVGIEIVCTGTPTGVISVQCSIDYVPPSKLLVPSVTPATWSDIPLGLNPLVGAPETYIIDIVNTGLPWIRIAYVATSGTGNITAVVVAKES